MKGLDTSVLLEYISGYDCRLTVNVIGSISTLHRDFIKECPPDDKLRGANCLLATLSRVHKRCSPVEKDSYSYDAAPCVGQAQKAT
jgi:hypothetical protein